MAAAAPIEKEDKFERDEREELDIDENAPLCPTHAFYIVPHGMFTKEIKVLDRTSVLQGSDSALTDADMKSIVALAKESTRGDTAFTVSRRSSLSQRYTVKDHQGSVVAHWKHPVFSTGTASLTFPAGSEHCSHPIESKVINWVRRTERFVQDSATYSWEFESKVMSNKMRLFQIIGNQRVEVGRYEEPHGYTSGGTLVLDSRKLDELVGLLTCVLVLKKTRQRIAEYGGRSNPFLY